MPFSSRSAPAAALLLLFFCGASCDNRGARNDGGSPPPPSGPPAPPPSALSLEILEPSGDRAVTRGSTTQVVFMAMDPEAKARVSIVADRDGDRTTTADQYELVSADAPATTTTQDIAALLPPDIAFGTYAILGTLADGERPPVHAAASGRLLVDISHTLQINAPASDVTIARGGHVQVTFVCTDADGTSDVRFLADVDGNALTTGDQYPLATLTTALQTPQTRTISLAGLPLGTYRILGVASDAGNPDVVATAAGGVEVTNVAFVLQEGGADYEEGRAIAAFPDASLVVTGRFAGSAFFGEWPAMTSLNSTGDDDAFVARYAAGGALAWAIQAGGPSRGDWGKAVACLADGSVLVGGYFHGLAAFNGGGIASGVLSAGEDDAFLARYSPNGTLQWVQRAGGVFRDEIQALAVLADGSCVVAGQFSAQATFGTGSTLITLLVNGPLLTTDGFVARYLADGSLAWVKQFGGAAGNDQGTSIAVAADGSCTVAGTFVGTATFGEGQNQLALTSAGGLDIFVARYDASGALLWARRGGGPSDDHAHSAASLPDGSSFACGAFVGAATLGAGQGQATIQSAGGRDAFVAQFAPDGTLRWIRSAGGANDDDAMGIAASDDGSCFVTGSFHTAAVFGHGATSQNIAAFGVRDVFIARYDSGGALLWVRRAGGTNHDVGLAITALADGSCAVTGAFQGNATFGAGSASVMRSAVGFADTFVVRLNADGDF